MKLDHVAIAAPDHRPVLQALTGELGALVLSGGTPPRAGFRAMQVRLGRGLDGMTVEILEPYQPENNDFLARFVEATGGGVHHITFKTDDIVAEQARLQSIGIEPVGVDFADPGWKEMFIHPKDAHGTVIQIAQSGWEPPPMDEWLAALPEALMIFDQSESGPWWDPSCVATAGVAATLERVVIATPDLDAGSDFYVGVLGGEADDRSVRWDGGEIALEESTDRPRVERLEIRGHATKEITGVRFVETRPR
ncbi:MAG: VOC family protein [Acidimicrobiia bacterium]